jgi:hypothetical protein
MEVSSETEFHFNSGASHGGALVRQNERMLSLRGLSAVDGPRSPRSSSNVREYATEPTLLEANFCIGFIYRGRNIHVFK